MYVSLVYLVAAIVLLLWAVRMVRTAVERSYGVQLRRALGFANRSPLAAAGAGTAMAIVLQSSSATAVLAAGFAAGGLMTVATGIAVMLGADLGSAIVVAVLSLDLDWLVPLLIIIGGLLFLRGQSRPTRQTGRLILGVGFVLLSLQMMGDSEVLPVLVGYLSGDPITAFIIAAILSWLIHSSIAAILLVVSFTQQGLIPLEMAVPLVLGANLGAGLIAIGLTRGADLRARRIPLGNFIFRALAAIVVLAGFQLMRVPLTQIPLSPAMTVIAIHVAFNMLLIVVCLPFAGLMGRLAAKILPDAPEPETEINTAKLRRPALLGDPGNLDQAFAAATRELLRMSEIVEVMFQPVMDLYQNADKARIRQIKQLEEEVNNANKSIKLFLARLDESQMDADQQRRMVALTSFAINLEQVGDIITKLLVKLAEQRAARDLSFSPEGWDELTNFHARVLTNMQLALNVLVSEDTDSARQLVEEKDEIGQFERHSQQRHLKRLRSGAITSIETSDIHLETLHAFKRINSLISGIAYAILSDSGDLLDSRLYKG
jgi:phosphate:Na+ symporter